MLRPLTPRITFRAGYELEYTRLRRAPETAPAFVVPADQVAHGARLAIEGQRGGWAASVWWNPVRRHGLARVGRRGRVRASPDDNATTSATVSTVGRSTAVTPRLVTRVEGQAVGGNDLDRFSRYSFGTFDNRLHGYPSALVRYDRGARGQDVSRMVRRRDS